MCVLFGDDVPWCFGVLVAWWFVVVCVALVCLVLVVCCVGITPLWCGVLGVWYVGVNVFVFRRAAASCGLVVLVCWW